MIREVWDAKKWARPSCFYLRDIMLAILRMTKRERVVTHDKAEYSLCVDMLTVISATGSRAD